MKFKNRIYLNFDAKSAPNWQVILPTISSYIPGTQMRDKPFCLAISCRNWQPYSTFFEIVEGEPSHLIVTSLSLKIKTSLLVSSVIM